MKKYLLGLLILGTFLLYFPAGLAETGAARKTVKILSWWGYYFPEVRSQIENKCHVKISLDEYYSNDEFLRRWEGQAEYYDIINLSDIVYPLIKNQIPRVKNSTIWKNSLDYYPAIKKHYDKQKYPHNVAYFHHLLIGFLWNSSNIKLSKNDSINSIFSKAKNKYVVLVDDPVDAMKLIETSLGFKGNAPRNYLSASNLKKMIQDTHIYIANNNNPALKHPNFAFSYRWIGPAVSELIQSEHSNYKFLVHPKLSHISSTLIVQTSDKTPARCVANALTSKDVITIIQKKYFFFSPFADYKNVTNPVIKNLYQQFKTSLPFASWLDDERDYHFREINRTWQLIKLGLNSRLRIHEVQD